MMMKKIGYVFAACIIFVALMVMASRLLIPLLEKHHADIEARASELLKLPITIKKVRISWYQYQPEISLGEVTILNKETKEPVLQIQKVRVFFSIPQSLWQRKLIPSGILISGTEMNVYEKPTGEIAVQGFPSLEGFSGQPYKSESKFVDVMGWLSQMPRLILSDVDLRYVSKNGIKRFLTFYQLRFENTGTKHIILGKVLLHQTVPTEVTMTVQWHGDSVDMDKIDVNAYLFVSGLSIAQWWKDISWNGWQINAGRANAKIWTIWTHGAFRKIQCSFESYGLDLYSAMDKSTHRINRFSGEVGWKREGQEQVLAGDNIFIDFPTHLWPSTSFYVALSPDATGKLLPTAVNLGYVDLADAQTFLFSSPALVPDSWRHLLSELKITGDIQSLSVMISSTPVSWDHLSLNGRVSRLSVAPWHSFPGVKNLSGNMTWNGIQGDLELHSNQTVFQQDAIFLHPITIDQLSGNVLWQLDQDKNWLVRLKALQAFNRDVAINANGLFTLPPAGSPHVDLNAHFTMQQAKQVTRYLPMRIFDPALIEWLQGAFLSGAVESGSATLRGVLTDFPFDKGNGQFEISAVTKNVNFHYAPDWPALKNVNGKLVFSGRQMSVDVAHAEIEGITASDVHGVIPYLGEDKPQILKVQSGGIQADFSQGLGFVHASPLEKTIGKMFTGTTVTGPMVLKLGLTVPLSNPDNTTVEGDITFKEAMLNLIPWRLVIDKLHGQLHFTEKSTEASGIQGTIFNKPLQLNLLTQQKKPDTSVVRAVVSTHLGADDLEKWLNVPFSQVINGESDVSATLDFALNAPIEIQLQSDLVGMAVNLPDQYAKERQAKRLFTATIIAEDKQPLRLQMRYGDQLGAALVLNQQVDKLDLTAANLRLGGGIATLPSSAGLYITGELNQLDWNKIKGYMDQSASTAPAGLVLHQVDMQIKQLLLPGQLLTEARIQVAPTENNWDVTIASAEVNGRIQVPKKWIPESVVTAQFQKLALRPVSNMQSITKFDINSLPAISFTANNVSYNNMPLGQISFKTIPTSNGLTIRSLTVLSPRLELSAQGAWTTSTTTLQGAATSTNVSQLLNGLGFDVHNFVSGKGHFDFNLSWHAAPYSLTLASMSGRASLNLGQGRIVELSQTSGAKMDLGRMLNIFSLQTIPRRLSLDFSDVLQKGYSFDSLRGDFKFEKGNAYTSNTRFDGPVARVDIYGRIGLSQTDYDLTLSVTPYVTSSIPVAATLITGQPVIGIAAWAVDKVISSSVSKATTYFYAVSGPWSNPTWNSVKVPKKNQ